MANRSSLYSKYPIDALHQIGIIQNSFHDTNNMVNFMIEEITPKELSALISRVEHAIEHDLALSSDDLKKLLLAITTLVTVQQKLEDQDVTLLKLRKLLGIVRQSEKRRAENKRTNKGNSNKKRQARKQQQPKPTIEHHELVEHKSGQACPHCTKGKLYKYEPGRLLRITGSTPYRAVEHITQRLRCNACQELISAPLPAEVLADGDANQKYGYSARALMAVHKFYSGVPYNHQGNLSDLMGCAISASTIFDQCELVANAIMPVFYCLRNKAADAVSYLLDDTHHNILEQKPQMRPNRRGTGERLRTGVYGSGLIALTQQDQEIVLFETSLGHAGEFIDDILKKRTQGLAPPLVMSDALSSNLPTITEVQSCFCNAHCRRLFYDLEDKCPGQIGWLLETYGLVWQHDKQTRQMNADERLAYHQQHSLPVMESIKSWALRLQSEDEFEEHSALGKAIRYLLKHYERLTKFCYIPGALIDNNRMEETLKILIRGRKTAYFFKTVNGAGVANVITSIIATACRANINIFEYLTHLQRFKSDVRSNPERWLPWEYMETIQKLLTRSAEDLAGVTVLDSAT